MMSEKQIEQALKLHDLNFSIREEMEPDGQFSEGKYLYFREITNQDQEIIHTFMSHDEVVAFIAGLEHMRLIHNL